MRPLVYDVGMNNGDDVEYYLAKGLRVIGIEANEDLCRLCTSRFANDISSGNLKIIQRAVGPAEGEANFFINNREHVRSTLVPQDTEDGTWSCSPIQISKLSSIIRQNGEPFYVKIDVEFMDHVILKDLSENKIIPPYISSESHVIDVFRELICMGYEYFNLIDGASVYKKFHHHRIALIDGGTAIFDFPSHSTGPFGDDIPEPWLNQNQLLQKLMAVGLGWKDIHATTIVPSRLNLWTGDLVRYDHHGSIPRR